MEIGTRCAGVSPVLSHQKLKLEWIEFSRSGALLKLADVRESSARVTPRTVQSAFSLNPFCKKLRDLPCAQAVEHSFLRG